MWDVGRRKNLTPPRSGGFQPPHTRPGPQTRQRALQRSRGTFPSRRCSGRNCGCVVGALWQPTAWRSSPGRLRHAPRRSAAPRQRRAAGRGTISRPARPPERPAASAGRRRICASRGGCAQPNAARVAASFAAVGLRLEFDFSTDVGHVPPLPPCHPVPPAGAAAPPPLPSLRILSWNLVQATHDDGTGAHVLGHAARRHP